MDPLTIGSLGAGLLGGIFGGRSRRNPYSAEINRNAASLAALRDTYAQNAASAQNNYNRYAPQAFQTIDDYGDYLQTDPYTDSASTRYLNTATAGTNAAYGSARSNLAAEMAARGITGSSSDLADSSAIEAARAAQYAAAQSALAQAKITQRQNNLKESVGLYNAVAEGERSAMNQGLGAQAGITSNLLNTYTGMNSYANQQNAYDDAQRQNALAGAGGLFGTLLSQSRRTKPGNGSGNGAGYTTGTTGADIGTNRFGFPPAFAGRSNNDGSMARRVTPAAFLIP